MKTSLILLGHRTESKPVFEFRDRNQTIEQPTAVRPLHGPGVLGVARLEFARNRFHDVLQGDDSEDLTVLIDHEGKLNPRGTEILQQLHSGETFGHKNRRLQKAFAGQIERFTTQRCPQ